MHNSLLSSHVTSFGPHSTLIISSSSILFNILPSFCHHLKLWMYVLSRMKISQRHVCLVHCFFSSARGRKKERGRRGVTILLEIGPPNRYEICTLNPAFHIKPKLLSCEDADSHIGTVLSAPIIRIIKVPPLFSPGAWPGSTSTGPC